MTNLGFYRIKKGLCYGLSESSVCISVCIYVYSVALTSRDAIDFEFGLKLQI